jgi:hypothetical protein
MHATAHEMTREKVCELTRKLRKVEEEGPWDMMAHHDEKLWLSTWSMTEGAA